MKRRQADGDNPEHLPLPALQSRIRAHLTRCASSWHDVELAKGQAYEHQAQGFRYYAPETAARVRFVKRAQALGMSLEEVVRIAPSSSGWRDKQSWSDIPIFVRKWVPANAGSAPNGGR